MEDVPHFPGTLLWTKVRSHPFWPCMVTYDPNNGKFFKITNTKTHAMSQHVQYFGTLQHGWTTGDSMFFQGGDRFFAKTKAEISQASHKQKQKLRKKYYVPSSVMKEWLNAVKEAEKALRFRVEDRHEMFVFKYDINFKKTEKVKIKRKRKKGVSKPAKKLPPKAISEATSIVEPLCFYCERGNVDLFCTSGICAQSFHKQCIGIINAPNFLCAYCSVDEQQPCVSCKIVGAGTTKCSKCQNYYHDYCLKYFKSADLKNNICSAHVCWTCYGRNPRSPRNHAGTLVTCFRCFMAYHDTIDCLPVGYARLSPNVIICPRHFEGKNKISPQSMNSVNFCSACFSGGKLVCCEACPQAYHAACVNREIPRGDFFCDDCTEKKDFHIGMLVWAKSGFFRWWPAQILNPEKAPSNIRALHRYDGEFLIQFFGTDEYAWTHRGKVFAYTRLNRNMRVSCSRANKDIWRKFRISLEEAAEAFKEFEDQAAKDTNSKPAHFRHIRVNRAISPAVIFYVPQSACLCSYSEEDPCSPGSLCLNRTMMYECHPDYCKAKDKCQNQRFQKREYASVKVFKTTDRGWGLKATKFIQKGSFVIEYVGEIITQRMYEQRIVQMRILNDKNFYFMSLDKGRLIDAGPSGNLSRFINHSCNPNCVLEKWTINGDLRIGIFALADIKVDQEITFNYQSDNSGLGQECYCGAPNCVGVIGRSGKKRKLS